MSGPFVSQPSSPFQIRPDLERNQDSSDLPGELLRPLTRLCFPLLLQGSFSLLALSPRWKPLSFTVESALSFPCSLSDPPLSRQDAALAHLDSLPPHDLVISTDDSVPFSFGKGGLTSFDRPNLLKFFR